MFRVTTEHLQQLCRLNGFPITPGDMVFLGFRGCLPINPTDHRFHSEQSLTAANVDHLHPRCTLVQWLSNEGRLAVYPGSTVPNVEYTRKALAHGGNGANQLLTGFFADFCKGIHKAGTPTAHEAFRETNARPVRRTVDNLEYEADDRVEMDNPGDNLHAAWCGSVADPHFASAGCQVVVGYPHCPRRGSLPNAGPWQAFHDAAYSRAQRRFGYVLVNGFEIQCLALVGPAGLERVRFGSVGPRAEQVQAALKKLGYYEGHVGNSFGDRSLRALLEFQHAAFGRGAADGICGLQTAAALDLTWP
jgi:hypothetical protein